MTYKITLVFIGAMEWYSFGDKLENFVDEGFYVHDFERDIDICDFDVNYFDECASEFSPVDSKITSVVAYHRSAVEIPILMIMKSLPPRSFLIAADHHVG